MTNIIDWNSPWMYFTDAVLRAPTIGCMLMCLSAALVGVIAFLRKQSLVGESLSHAAYPGVILGVICVGAMSIDESGRDWLSIFSVIGAFFSAVIGLWLINYLEKRWKIPPDAALCFVLSSFFGIGITLASHVQFAYSSLYKQSLSYLYGQAATMTDIHIVMYGGLSVSIIIGIMILYKELQVIIFDRDFAKSLGIRVGLIDAATYLLMTLAIVIGIRSVGVVLMSGMLIAPAVAARQYTHRLSLMLILAGFFGLISGYLGNYFSVELSNVLAVHYPQARIALPTGPMIILVATFICVISLLIAPERGVLIRAARIAYFRYQCLCENLLKAMWRGGAEKKYSFSEIKSFQMISSFYLFLILRRLSRHGWIKWSESDKSYQLTIDGVHRSAHIVRLHRLWELYLTDYLGIGVERVHRSAEEMEHILTPDIERELTVLLQNPKVDPHQQPIPPHPYEQGR